MKRLLAFAILLAHIGLAQMPPTLTTLHNFVQPYGTAPAGGIAIGANGVLYGTTQAGGAPPCQCGTVYSLASTSATGATWREKVLYSFTSGAQQPIGRLMIAANSVLFGAAGNAVYSLTPPSVVGGEWTYATLYTFAPGVNLAGGLTMDSKGVLYGATVLGGAGNSGLLFSLTPSQTIGGSYTETTLYNFTGGVDGGYPSGQLTIGAGSVLFGTAIRGGAHNLGTVYEAAPAASGSSWNLTTLHSFAGGSQDGYAPEFGVVIGEGGVLYGTTANGGLNYGTVFSLTPPTAGGATWKETLIYVFKGGENDGAVPWAGLVIGNPNTLRRNPVRRRSECLLLGRRLRNAFLRHKGRSRRDLG